MTRTSGLAISLLAGGAVAVGAYSGLTRAHLGLQPSPQARAARSVVAARDANLNRYAATLDSALARRPPRLPGVPHYKPVVIPKVPRLVIPSARMTTPSASQTVLIDQRATHVPVAPHTANTTTPPPRPAVSTSTTTTTTAASPNGETDDSGSPASGGDHSDDGSPGGEGDDGSNGTTGSWSHDG